MSEPNISDVVLGGQNANLRSSLVLGGIEGVKKQLTSQVSERHKCEALVSALKYKEEGRKVILEALKDPCEEVKWTAYQLLMASKDITQQVISSLIETRFCENEESLVKKALKSRVEEEVKEYSGATIGTDFPLSLEGSGAKIESADVAVILPSGYMLALMIVKKPINTAELSRRSREFFNNGIDVIWWLSQDADTSSNRRWSIKYCGFAYILKTTEVETELNGVSKFLEKNCERKIRELNWQLQYSSSEKEEELTEEKLNYEALLSNGSPIIGMGQSIFGRALEVTFYVWRRLTNEQLKRGLVIQNKGIKSFGGKLGSLASHNHHTRVTAIAKRGNHWEVTDEEQLAGPHLGFGHCRFATSGVQAIKKRAHAIAQIKAEANQKKR
jgi:hypothetical protein